MAAGDTNITGFTLNAGGHLPPDRRLDRLVRERHAARRRPVQRRWFAARRRARQLIADRELHRRLRWAPDGRGRLAVRSAGRRPVAASSGRPTRRSSTSRTLTTAPGSAPSRRSADGPGGVLSSIGSSPFADLQTAPCWVEISQTASTCSRSTRPPRRSQVLDRQRRIADPDRLDTVLERRRRRRRGRAPLARRLDALGRRGGAQHRRRLLRQRWQPHRADRLAVRGRARRDALGHRRHLVAAPDRGGGAHWAASPRVDRTLTFNWRLSLRGLVRYFLQRVAARANLNGGVPAIRETAGPPTRRRFDPQTLVVRNAAFRSRSAFAMPMVSVSWPSCGKARTNSALVDRRAVLDR